jgi:hypothetical protein
MEVLTFDLSVTPNTTRILLYDIPFDYTDATNHCLEGGDGSLTEIRLGPGEARVVVVSKMSSLIGGSWTLSADNFR